MSLSKLPWVTSFLGAIQEEQSRLPPHHTEGSADEEDMKQILSVAQENDPFDTARLKKQNAEALLAGKAKVIKSTCDLGSICVIEFNAHPFRHTWNTWWRAVRLICGGAIQNGKDARILIFGHPKKRIAPHMGEPLAAEHVNGGATFRCNPGTVVVYRQEEATRVLIHELLHSSCSDPYHKTTPEIEADTEAWAEMVLCGMAAKGNQSLWERLMNQQIRQSLQQSASVATQHSVNSPHDYAWRYLTGRLGVWERLGLRIPVVTSVKPIQSLRFTTCEPKDV